LLFSQTAQALTFEEIKAYQTAKQPKLKKPNSSLFSGKVLGATTDLTVYPIPPLPPRPDPGVVFIDPTFGTSMMRVTGPADGSQCMNGYSYWSSFNLNSTKFLAYCDYNIILYELDPVNFAITGKQILNRTTPGGSVVSWADAWFSSIYPNIIFFCDNFGSLIFSYNTDTKIYTTLKDFKSLIGPNDVIVNLMKSNDDDIFNVTVRDKDTGISNREIVWKKSTDQIIFNKTTSELPGLNRAQLDKSGKYLVTWNNSSDTIPKEVVFDLSTGNLVKELFIKADGGGVSHMDVGNGIAVGWDPWTNNIIKIPLNEPLSFKKVLLMPDWLQDGHISMRANDETWGLRSAVEYDVANTTKGLFHNEIFLFATDGSGSVRRLAHHRSLPHKDIPGGLKYFSEPRANISPDGRFVAFTSNWENDGKTDWSNPRLDFFILKVPDAVNGTMLDTTPPVFSNIISSGVSSSGATISWTTSENSDTQVEYGTTIDYGSSSNLNPTLLTHHTVVLSGLSPNKLYHFRVKSRDSSFNFSISGDQTFTTLDFTPSLADGGSRGSLSIASSSPSSIPNNVSVPVNVGDSDVLISNTRNSNLVILPANVKSGELIRFANSRTVYLVRPDGLYPFSSLQSLQQYSAQSGQKQVAVYKSSAAEFTVRSTFAGEILNQTADLSPITTFSRLYSIGSLVNNNGTIYFIAPGNKKIAFTSMQAFNGLGYSLRNVVKGDLTSYALSTGFFLSSSNQEHPWGSWLKNGSTIYYSTEQGIIPVPAWEIFLNNGGQSKLIVPMSKAEQKLLGLKLLPVMTINDGRILK
jgi:hypothetical protein